MVKVLKTIFNFYINASIHVALSVYAMSWFTLIIFNLDYEETVLNFIFFATITAYNFVKYFGLAKFHHRSLTNRLKAIQIFSALAFVLMCYYLAQLRFNLLWFICILAFVTFLYAIPLIPKRYLFDEHQNLRQIGGLKVYIIALVWAFVTVALPLLNAEIIFGVDQWLTVLQRFSFVIVLMLPFEIRDLNYDSLKLSTIPQKIGIKKTKIFGILVLVLFVSIEFFKENFQAFTMISTLMIALVTLTFLTFSSEKQSKYYSSFWVESIPILWLLLVLFF